MVSLVAAPAPCRMLPILQARNRISVVLRIDSDAEEIYIQHHDCPVSQRRPVQIFFHIGSDFEEVAFDPHTGLK